MCTKIKKINAKEVIHILILFSFIVFGILRICGTITSGIHLVDDHEFWDFSYKLNTGMSFAEVVSQKMKGDFIWRFRPLYYPLRVLQSAVLGTDLFVMSILKGIEVVLACELVYLIARKLGCSIWISIVSSFFVLVGPQSATWWKLGPQELTGTWIFALGILCILKWMETSKKLYNMIAIICVLFVSMYKESFIALIPTVMLIYIYFSMENKKITWKNLTNAIRENLLVELVLGGILLAEAYVILFVIGTDEMEYIGVGASTPIWYYLKVFLNNFRLYLRVGQYGVFALAIMCIMWKDLKDIVVKSKWHILLACTMILPQFVLYAKSGLEERYVIPWVYGVGYLFVIVLCKSEVLKGKKKKYYDIALVILLVVNFAQLFYEAAYFTYRGQGVTQMYDKVREVATSETNIMTAFRPYDESYHSTVEILRVDGLENIYLEKDGKISDIYGNNQISFDEIDIVLMYNEKDRHYIYDQGLDLSDFEITDYNTVTMAVRKN